MFRTQWGHIKGLKCRPLDEHGQHLAQKHHLAIQEGVVLLFAKVQGWQHLASFTSDSYFGTVCIRSVWHLVCVASGRWVIFLRGECTGKQNSLCAVAASHTNTSKLSSTQGRAEQGPHSWAAQIQIQRLCLLETTLMSHLEVLLMPDALILEDTRRLVLSSFSRTQRTLKSGKIKLYLVN